MKAGRPKLIPPAQRARMAGPSCEKCGHLVTGGGDPACRLGRKPLVLCADYRDVSRPMSWQTGGITGIVPWGGK